MNKPNRNQNSTRGSSKSPIICRCNNVSEEKIHQAIRDGARSMNEIFDKTTAGVGPCGGSCRWKLQPILDGYLATGEFPPLQDIIKKLSANGKK